MWKKHGNLGFVKRTWGMPVVESTELSYGSKHLLNDVSILSFSLRFQKVLCVTSTTLERQPRTLFDCQLSNQIYLLRLAKWNSSSIRVFQMKVWRSVIPLLPHLTRDICAFLRKLVGNTSIFWSPLKQITYTEQGDGIFTRFDVCLVKL
jgi:hypothetical protein